MCLSIITRLLSATIVPYCVDPIGAAKLCFKLEIIELGMSAVHKPPVKEHWPTSWHCNLVLYIQIYIVSESIVKEVQLIEEIRRSAQNHSFVRCIQMSVVMRFTVFIMLCTSSKQHFYTTFAMVCFCVPRTLEIWHQCIVAVFCIFDFMLWFFSCLLLSVCLSVTAFSYIRLLVFR